MDTKLKSAIDSYIDTKLKEYKKEVKIGKKLIELENKNKILNKKIEDLEQDNKILNKKIEDLTHDLNLLSNFVMDNI